MNATGGSACKGCKFEISTVAQPDVSHTCVTVRAEAQVNCLDSTTTATITTFTVRTHTYTQHTESQHVASRVAAHSPRQRPPKTLRHTSRNPCTAKSFELPPPPSTQQTMHSCFSCCGRCWWWRPDGAATANKQQHQLATTVAASSKPNFMAEVQAGWRQQQAGQAEAGRVRPW